VIRIRKEEERVKTLDKSTWINRNAFIKMELALPHETDYWRRVKWSNRAKLKLIYCNSTQPKPGGLYLNRLKWFEIRFGLGKVLAHLIYKRIIEMRKTKEKMFGEFNFQFSIFEAINLMKLSNLSTPEKIVFAFNEN